MPIIQATPNLSVTMPKSGDQKVFANGIWTEPPLLRLVKKRFTSASSSQVMEI